jgi:hypothetical protein
LCTCALSCSKFNLTSRILCNNRSITY